MTERNDHADAERPVDLFFRGRREAIAGERCMPAPIGCGKSIRDANGDFHFRDAPSAKEFTISGLCQVCQDEVFGA